MKVECPQLKRNRHSGDKKKKSLMFNWDDLDNEKSNSPDDEQANICLMVDMINVKFTIFSYAFCDVYLAF